MKVDWSQSGETVEDLVAVLLRRENPMATQIRPSQGDGGMDVRTPLAAGGVEIYQVKKFNPNLTTSQLRQIQDSFNSLNEYRLEQGLDVRGWHLLMPLNPTKENVEWLGALTKQTSFPCDWRGRDYLDGLAAKFPDVVDYYLENGAERWSVVIKQLTDLLGLGQRAERAGLVTPAQAMDQLRTLRPLLDTDPHFQYAISLDPAMPDPAGMGTGFIAALMSAWEGGSAVTVKIFPRFAEALRYRPVPGTFVVHAEPGSDLEAELNNFIKYGTPLRAPLGSTDFSIDLPGDLGGSFQGGAVRVGPAIDPSPGRRLRLAAVDESGGLVATAMLDIHSRSVGLGGTGFWSAGTDATQTFDVEFRGDLEANTLKLSLDFRDPAGRAPDDVLDAVRFLLTLRSPNTLLVAQPFGPLTGQRIALETAEDWLNFVELRKVELAIETLSAIQRHTPMRLVVPPLESIDAEAVNAWTTARKLLEGQVVSLLTFNATVCLAPEAEAPASPTAIALESDFSVRIGEQLVDLGMQITHAPSAEVVPGSIVPHGDHLDCTLRASDGVEATIRLPQTAT